MSAVTPPIATGNHTFATAADKEALVEFWRTGLEHIARGISAHHSLARDARIRDVYARREPPSGSPGPSLDPQITLHKETLETCVLALAELAASGLAQLSLSHQTQQSPSLEARLVTLEDQMKALQATVQPLDAKLKALNGNLNRIDSRIKVCEGKANASAIRVEESHKDLESRIAESSKQVSNPPPIQSVGQDWVNERLEPMQEKIQEFQGESERLKERLTTAEAKITVVEATRSRVDVHGTKLALMEGKFEVLQKDLRETRTKLGAVSALSSVPAQIQQAGKDIESLKEQQKEADVRLNSSDSALKALEQKLGETVQKNPGMDSLAVDISEFNSLKQHVSSLVKLPTTVEQLEASVAELAPLKLRSQDLTAIAAQTPQLLGLISHNERVQDDIAQIRSKLARHNKEMADAKKENAENAESLKAEMMALSSTASRMQGEISETAHLVTELELSVKRVEEISQDMSEKFGGIDGRFKANQVTAQWAQEHIRAMRADITYLEPLKERREALMLLSGRTEEIMLLSMQLGSPEFQKIIKKGEQADATMVAVRQLTSEMVAACKDVQRRLSRVEPHVNQLESDVSNALEKLTALEGSSGAMDVQIKDTMGSLQKIQSDVTPLLTFKTDLLNLAKLAPHCTSLVSLVDEVPALRQVHANNITPMKGEIKKIKSTSTALRKDVDDTKGMIEPLLNLQQQLSDYKESVEKLERKVAKLEPGASSSNTTGSSTPLTIRIPPANRASNFSLQSLNPGSSGSGPTRWKASTTNTPKKSSNASQQSSQPEPPSTPPPAPQAQSQPPLSGPGALDKLTQVADELVAMIEKSKKAETDIANLTRSLGKYNKQIEEFGDSVHEISQLTTTAEKKSDDSQAALKILERDFQKLKEENAAKLKEIDFKQAQITVLENEFQSLKFDLNVKLKLVEATTNELAPLKEHADILIALAEPVLSPVSPAPHVNAAPPPSRFAELMQLSRSHNKEIKSLVAWAQKTGGELKYLKNLSNDHQELEGRVRQLADSIETMNPLAASLAERAPDLLRLLERPSDQSIQLTPEQLEGVARATTRMKAFEEQLQVIRTSQPKLEEDLGRVTSQVGQLVPTINKVVKPFTDHVQSILSLVPLSNHVPSLVPLIDQVPQLHASMQSLSDRVDAAASAAAAATTHNPPDPSPASQLRSPVTDRELSPVEESSLSDNGDTALFVPATSEPRPKKRRRMEEMIESLEHQIDSVRGELDGVADDVKILCAERGKVKKIRPNTLEKKQPIATHGEAPPPRKKLEEDLDTIMDQLRSLFEGEGPWPERIDVILGRQWAQALQSPQLQCDAGASATIAKLCEELEALKIVVEAYGSGTPAPPSAIDAVHVAWAENLTDKVMVNVNKEQAQFKAELEELINRALQPVKKVFKLFKESPDIDV